MVEGEEEERRAAAQKKTKRYMDPSKAVEARARARMLGFVRMGLRRGAGLVGWLVVEGEGVPWFSSWWGVSLGFWFPGWFGWE